ncbi:MAG: hypothetical protein WD425_04705 [Nitrospirales bacterium]
MLTDIFARRYEGTVLWETFEEKDRQFLVQAFRIISEQFHPYYNHAYGSEDPGSKKYWGMLNDKLSLELGLETLSAKAYSYPLAIQGTTTNQVGTYSLLNVCKNFVCGTYISSIPADRFMKERISFIEIAFREREYEIDAEIESWNSSYVGRRLEHGMQAAIQITPTKFEGKETFAERKRAPFLSAVTELNTRFSQANYDLHYHNGFIQRSTDQLTEEQIEDPFWSLVSDAMWKNVDTDMKEAIDRRDNQGRDPALYAAKALESAIKIISIHKRWTTGHEKGVQYYLDNLGSKKNKYINDWEKESLKIFFGNVRNPLGHGPGNEPMPELTLQQTDWAIEFCMIWIKTLIRRF